MIPRATARRQAPVYIETARLVLRRPTEEDAEMVYHRIAKDREVGFHERTQDIQGNVCTICLLESLSPTLSHS